MTTLYQHSKTNGRRNNKRANQVCNKKIREQQEPTGPDGLPAEFYKIYEDIITEPLKEALDECYKSGDFTGSMKQGDIVLIYKEKDPKEIRNYRPITLRSI